VTAILSATQNAVFAPAGGTALAEVDYHIGGSAKAGFRSRVWGAEPGGWTWIDPTERNSAPDAETHGLLHRALLPGQVWELECYDGADTGQPIGSLHVFCLLPEPGEVPPTGTPRGSARVGGTYLGYQIGCPEPLCCLLAVSTATLTDTPANIGRWLQEPHDLSLFSQFADLEVTGLRPDVSYQALAFLSDAAGQWRIVPWNVHTQSREMTRAHSVRYRGPPQWHSWVARPGVGLAERSAIIVALSGGAEQRGLDSH